MEIAGRAALVTGAGIGTGRAIALALAGAGAEVVVSDVDEAGGERAAAEPPPLIGLRAVADAVLRLVRDDALAGRTLLLLRGEPPRLV